LRKLTNKKEEKYEKKSTTGLIATATIVAVLMSAECIGDESSASSHIDSINIL